MPEALTPEERSALMGRIRRANTKPERLVRSMLHQMGYRFRIQLGGVPGRPDIAFPARRKVIFVHGCFWHGHQGCANWRMPKTRVDFWRAKINRNQERDRRLESAAALAGWDCLVVWECETDDHDGLERRLRSHLGPTRFSLSR